MTTTTTTSELVPGYVDVTRLAVASFLARYREPTLTAYTQDLKAFLGCCDTFDREVLGVTRGELEMYVRYLESRGYAAATIARRFGTVATFYKYAVVDGVIAANPAVAVTRPKVAWEGQSARCCTAGVRCPAGRGPNLRPERPRPGLPARHARAAGVGSLRYRHHRSALRGRLRAAARARQGRQASRHPTAHPGTASRAESRRRPHRGADPADPDRTADGPSRSQPGPHPGHARRWHHPPDQPTRSAPHVLHHRAGRRHRNPRHAVRVATPTHAPPCATTWPGPTSTATPPTPSPPTWPA
jgi:hypothetical protein